MYVSIRRAAILKSTIRSYLQDSGGAFTIVAVAMAMPQPGDLLLLASLAIHMENRP